MVPPGKQELGLELETCCPLKQVPCGVPSPWPALLAWGGTGGEGRKVAQETKLRWRLSLLMVVVHLLSLDPFLCLVGGTGRKVGPPAIDRVHLATFVH